MSTSHWESALSTTSRLELKVRAETFQALGFKRCCANSNPLCVCGAAVICSLRRWGGVWEQLESNGEDVIAEDAGGREAGREGEKPLVEIFVLGIPLAGVMERGPGVKEAEQRTKVM